MSDHFVTSNATVIHGLTECERKRDDSKRTGFKEAGDDDRHCILLFEYES